MIDEAITIVKRKAAEYRDRANGRVSAHMPGEAQSDWNIAEALDALVLELEALGGTSGTN